MHSTTHAQTELGKALSITYVKGLRTFQAVARPEK